jgi:hypothetical protein
MVKVKISLLHVKQPQRGNTLVLEWSGWLGPCPCCFTSIVKDGGLALVAALNPGSLAYSMVQTMDYLLHSIILNINIMFK